VLGDTADEPDESFAVNLLSPSNATLGGGAAIGTILDDDVPVTGDTRPPQTKVGSGPPRKTKQKAARFKFSSDEAGSTFFCSLDRGAFKRCTSPKKYKVKRGKHTFAVFARDAAGNVDASPATHKWKVKKKGKRR
jgi:hypothetical protein